MDDLIKHTQYNIDTEDIEVQLFIDALYMKYGYDFRNYSRAHMKRRIMNRVKLSNYKSISHLQHDVLRDKELFDKILPDFSINVTEMFRDPEFFQSIRKNIMPTLRKYQKIKIWHAGCSSGEEVYSMAIVLKEEGLMDRCQIYATDFNEKILKKASDGIFPIEVIKDYTANYIKAKGNESFSDYYHAKYDSAIIDHELKKNIIFAQHNLVTDGVFGEMHLIVCRNVLIYFDKVLQEHVFEKFNESLTPGGHLCLGTKESLGKSKVFEEYDTIDSRYKIYQKKLIL